MIRLFLSQTFKWDCHNGGGGGAIDDKINIRIQDFSLEIRGVIKMAPGFPKHVTYTHIAWHFLLKVWKMTNSNDYLFRQIQDQHKGYSKFTALIRFFNFCEEELSCCFTELLDSYYFSKFCSSKSAFKEKLSPKPPFYEYCMNMLYSYFPSLEHTMFEAKTM